MKPIIKIARWDFDDSNWPAWLPWYYGRVGQDWDIPRTIFAWLGPHWLLRAWRWWGQRRWKLEWLGRQYGVYCLDEGDMWQHGARCLPLSPRPTHRDRSGKPIIVLGRLWR